MSRPLPTKFELTINIETVNALRQTNPIRRIFADKDAFSCIA
jgi:hypothetical protein